MKKLYETSVTAHGGRNGHVKSDNGILDLDVRMPQSMGGSNDQYTNPEQLFAAGYAACFDGALNLHLRKDRQLQAESKTIARVSLNQTDEGGFKLAVELYIDITGMEEAEIMQYAEKAHETCPYSKATRGNIEVKLHAGRPD